MCLVRDLMVDGWKIVIVIVGGGFNPALIRDELTAVSN